MSVTPKTGALAVVTTATVMNCREGGDGAATGDASAADEEAAQLPNLANVRPQWHTQTNQVGV